MINNDEKLMLYSSMACVFTLLLAYLEVSIFAKFGLVVLTIMWWISFIIELKKVWNKKNG